jgi:hypothetical protein
VKGEIERKIRIICSPTYFTHWSVLPLAPVRTAAHPGDRGVPETSGKHRWSPKVRSLMKAQTGGRRLRIPRMRPGSPNRRQLQVMSYACMLMDEICVGQNSPQWHKILGLQLQALPTPEVRTIVLGEPFF